MKLDSIDFKILKILQEQGNISNRELASKIGLAPSSCGDRKKRLKKEGFITSYHAEVNAEKLNIKVKAIVTIKLNHDKENHSNFLKKIEGISQVMESYRVSGRFDYILKIAVGGLNSFDNLIKSHFDNMAEINNIETHIVLSTEKNTHLLPMQYR